MERYIRSLIENNQTSKTKKEPERVVEPHIVTYIKTLINEDKQKE